MVWFQCEDYGDNLKKPTLANHFRACSTTKLSCIDCGQMFGQKSVQGHTQCITETEKYGPKGQTKPTQETVLLRLNKRSRFGGWRRFPVAALVVTGDFPVVTCYSQS